MTRWVALMPAPLAAPFGRLQSAPLPSQKTWMNMMQRLEAKYDPQAKLTRNKKRRKTKKRPAKKRPSKKALVKRGKSVTLGTTLRPLVQAFPQADHALKVWPKRSSLVSTVGRVPGSKHKLNTFL